MCSDLTSGAISSAQEMLRDKVLVPGIAIGWTIMTWFGCSKEYSEEMWEYEGIGEEPLAPPQPTNVIDQNAAPLPTDTTADTQVGMESVEISHYFKKGMLDFALAVVVFVSGYMLAKEDCLDGTSKKND